ncbi:MAG: type II secretion system F family protein, partial [Erysipelotrichaceae bacterium]|nr:type II secretion system F family protein [Erysipelotrichaceae bacterium]
FVKKLPSSILIGEETGSLDVMLNSVSDMLEYESEAAVNRMVGLLEPLMIVIMAVIVLFVIIGVILPIYNSYGSIGASAY